MAGNPFESDVIGAYRDALQLLGMHHDPRDVAGALAFRYSSLSLSEVGRIVQDVVAGRRAGEEATRQIEAGEFPVLAIPESTAIEAGRCQAEIVVTGDTGSGAQQHVGTITIFTSPDTLAQDAQAWVDAQFGEARDRSDRPIRPGSLSWRIVSVLCGPELLG